MGKLKTVGGGECVANTYRWYRSVCGRSRGVEYIQRVKARESTAVDATLHTSHGSIEILTLEGE